MIIHVPHASAVIPGNELGLFLLKPEELQAEIRRMTDWFTDEIAAAACPDAEILRHEVSRLVLDPERFRDDTDESMARRGMGAVYTKTADGAPLRDVTPEERERILRAYYDPHHARCRRAVESALDAHGSCLIIDLHSFPSKPLPYEDDQRVSRPDICIGTDDFHTPERCAGSLEDLCAKRGLSCERNRPFAGAFVPMPFYRRDARVTAIMIELNRALYMDEERVEKNAGYEKAVELVGAMCALLRERGRKGYHHRS